MFRMPISHLIFTKFWLFLCIKYVTYQLFSSFFFLPTEGISILCHYISHNHAKTLQQCTIRSRNVLEGILESLRLICFSESAN